MAPVEVSADAGVAVLRLNDPPLNPLSTETIRNLSEMIYSCSPSVRCLVLTGSTSAFAAGADLKELRDASTDSHSARLDLLRTFLSQLEALPIPTIAAIEGVAVGGGWELAMACDIRVASRQARIGLPEIRLGLLAAGGGTQRMLQALGKGATLDLLYTGRLLSGEEAHTLGLVERLSDPGEALTLALEYASGLTRSSHAALAAAKACVIAGMYDGMNSGLDQEHRSSVDLFDGEDAKEGIRAFLEKRSPRFPSSAEQ